MKGQVLNLLEEIPLWVRAINAPPIIDKDIEGTEDNHEECRRPFGLETDGNHSASGKTNQRDKCSRNAPLSPKHKSDEEEDEQNTSCEQEADGRVSDVIGDTDKIWSTHYFLRSVSLSEGKPAKSVRR